MVPSTSCTIGRRQPERRLVEHHQLRRAHQAAADRQHLLLAARQRAGRLPLRARPARGNIASTRSRFCVAPRARARQHRAHLEVFGNRQRRENLPALGHLADAEIADAMARPAGDIGAAEQDAAARRPQHAGDGADQRGLAGAVGADDGDDRALLDVERHAVERLRVAVEHIEVFDARASHAPPRRDRIAPRRDRARPPRGVPSAIAAP